MKLSMAIIEHWIRQYHPISTIISDEPDIYAVGDAVSVTNAVTRCFWYIKKM